MSRRKSRHTRAEQKQSFPRRVHGKKALSHQDFRSTRGRSPTDRKRNTVDVVPVTGERADEGSAVRCRLPGGTVLRLDIPRLQNGITDDPPAMAGDEEPCLPI